MAEKKEEEEPRKRKLPSLYLRKKEDEEEKRPYIAKPPKRITPGPEVPLLPLLEQSLPLPTVRFLSFCEQHPDRADLVTSQHDDRVQFAKRWRDNMQPCLPFSPDWSKHRVKKLHSGLERLPIDILRLIFGSKYLDRASGVACLFVSKRIRSAVTLTPVDGVCEAAASQAVSDSDDSANSDDATREHADGIRLVMCALRDHRGNYEFLRWIHTVSGVGGYSGNWTVLQWAVRHGWDGKVFTFVYTMLGHGDGSLFDDPPLPKDGLKGLVACCCQYDNIAMIEWLWVNDYDIKKKYLIHKACIEGRTRILDWARDHFKLEQEHLRIIQEMTTTHPHVKAWFDKHFTATTAVVTFVD
jgi:hypothetical protein